MFPEAKRGDKKLGKKYKSEKKEIQLLTKVERNEIEVWAKSGSSTSLALQTSLSHSVGLKSPKIFVLVDKAQMDESIIKNIEQDLEAVVDDDMELF